MHFNIKADMFCIYSNHNMKARKYNIYDTKMVGQGPSTARSHAPRGGRRRDEADSEGALGPRPDALGPRPDALLGRANESRVELLSRRRTRYVRSDYIYSIGCRDYRSWTSAETEIQTSLFATIGYFAPF